MARKLLHTSTVSGQFQSPCCKKSKAQISQGLKNKIEGSKVPFLKGSGWDRAQILLIQEAKSPNSNQINLLFRRLPAQLPNEPLLLLGGRRRRRLLAGVVFPGRVLDGLHRADDVHLADDLRRDDRIRSWRRKSKQGESTSQFRLEK